MDSSPHQRKIGRGYEIRTCKSSCRHSLITRDDLTQIIEKIIIESGLPEIAGKNPYGHLSHNRFKVSVSFCPNACTEPQIKDYGVIVRAIPEYTEGCTSCGLCEDVCEENAVSVEEYPEFDTSLCVGCGECWKACPTGAISASVIYEILIGGKLGRRPRFAVTLTCAKSMDEVLNILEFTLGFLCRKGKTRLGGDLGEFITEFHNSRV